MQHRWIIGIIAAFLLTSSVAHAATLEIPTPHTTVSGIGMISGWKCEAGVLTVRFDGGAPLPLLHGAERADVLNAGACDHATVGFLSIMNWGNLDDGEHTAVVYDDGVEFGRSVFTVRRFRDAFVKGAALTLPVQDFPHQGENAVFTWSQATQHLELADAFGASPDSDPPNCAGWVTGEGDGAFESAAWVEACLEAGADPNARDAYGNTPLYRFGEYWVNENERGFWDNEDKAGAIATLLLAAGADPNVWNNRGQTPLHAALTGYFPNLEVIVALLEGGADPNARDQDGDTPLGFLSHTDPADVERAFIRAGADPNLLDEYGNTHQCKTFECMAKKTYRMER